jgi:hypothetical protein
VGFITCCDHLFQMLVLRLDYFISGISMEREPAGSTQLLTGHRFHEFPVLSSNAAVTVGYLRAVTQAADSGSQDGARRSTVRVRERSAGSRWSGEPPSRKYGRTLGGKRSGLRDADEVS